MMNVSLPKYMEYRTRFWFHSVAVSMPVTELQVDLFICRAVGRRNRKHIVALNSCAVKQYKTLAPSAVAVV